MVKSKRVNPRRKPMTVEQALKVGQDRGVNCACAIFLTALLDKGFITKEQVPAVWDAVMYQSDSISRNYVTMHDLTKMLKDEYDIIL